MATNLDIDAELIERALAVSGEKTKKAAVTKALQEFIARRGQKRLRELLGQLEWDEGFDYKAERARLWVCSSIRVSGPSLCGAMSRVRVPRSAHW